MNIVNTSGRLVPALFPSMDETRTITISPIITDLILLFSAAQNCHRVTFAGRARGGDYGKGEGLPADSILYKFEDSTLFTSIVLGRSKATKSWRRPDSGFWHHVMNL